MKRIGISLFAVLLAGCAANAPMTYSPPPPVAIADDTPIGPRQVETVAVSTPTAVIPYGSGERHFGELRIPAGRGPFPVAMIVHGGCYTKGFATQTNLSPLASRLAEQGIATWNIDYRELGDLEQGWPAMMQDWAAGAAKLNDLAQDYPLDMSRLSVLGHSAGVTAAFWLGNGGTGVEGVDPSTLPTFTSAILLDGIMDMTPAVGPDVAVCGKPTIVPLIGGEPSDVAARYALFSPAQTPARVPMLYYRGDLQQVSPGAYERAVSLSAGRVTDVTHALPGHFRMIAPGTTAYADLEPVLLEFITKDR